MKTLTFDDLLPLDEFATRRREFFEAHGRYLDRYRRVRIGSCLTLLFENRQTLWFRLQEVLRIARLSEPARVQHELDLYNRLLPRRNRLQAALLLKVDDAHLREELAAWQDLRGEELCLHLGEALSRQPADLPPGGSLHRHRPLGAVRSRRARPATARRLRFARSLRRWTKQLSAR